MCKGGNLFLKVIILTMDQFALYFCLSRLFGPNNSRYSHYYVIKPTDRFDLGNLNSCKGGNCNF